VIEKATGQLDTMLYDGMGQRVLTIYGNNGSAGTLLSLDDVFELRRDDSGTEGRCRVTAGDTLVGDVVRTITPSGASSRDATFYLQDNVKSVLAEASTTGSITQRSRRDPFGNLVADATMPDLPSEPLAADPDGSSRLGFGGHERDKNWGIVDMIARAYSPRLGRFIAPDPILADPFDRQDHNPFAYVHNSPTAAFDPLGLDPNMDPPPPPSPGPTSGPDEPFVVLTNGDEAAAAAAVKKAKEQAKEAADRARTQATGSSRDRAVPAGGGCASCGGGDGQAGGGGGGAGGSVVPSPNGGTSEPGGPTGNGDSGGRGNGPSGSGPIRLGATDGPLPPGSGENPNGGPMRGVDLKLPKPPPGANKVGQAARDILDIVDSTEVPKSQTGEPVDNTQKAPPETVRRLGLPTGDPKKKANGLERSVDVQWKRFQQGQCPGSCHSFFQGWGELPDMPLKP
jgi:RHS repeat-associated protein